jgi:hypothetical protein
MNDAERPMVLMTQEEINEVADGINKGLYHPDIWRAKYIGKPFPLREVDFDEAEQAMILEMANKFGYPRMDIVRMAVRDAYFHYIVGGCY